MSRGHAPAVPRLELTKRGCVPAGTVPDESDFDVAARDGDGRRVGVQHHGVGSSSWWWPPASSGMPARTGTVVAQNWSVSDRPVLEAAVSVQTTRCDRLELLKG
jgi:hypothetical protein